MLCNSGQIFETAISRKLHGEEVGESEEEGPDEKVEATAIICIIILLIIITIAFEVCKEHIEEAADKTLKPIIASMFGEMTVLGFLSACTFVLVQSGVFEHMSVALFGEEEEELLVEIFEQVHFALFFIMLLFVIQVLVIVSQGAKSQKKWKALEKKCKDAAYIEKIKLETESKDDESALLLYGLRSEFIKERSSEPPFQEKASKSRLPESFNFGRYLFLSFGNIAAHVVHVHAESWGFFILLSLVMFVLILAVDVNVVILAWIWLGIGWATLGATLLFRRYLDNVTKAFSATPPSNATSDSEEGQLISSDLPAWCSIDLDEFIANRSWLAKRMSPHHPTRSDALLIFEREGPEFHLLFFQVSLIFVGLDGALLILTFFPAMFADSSTLVPLVYTVLAIIPIVLMISNVEHLMASLTVVGSIGNFRNPHLEATVIREEKTSRVVRAFLVLEKMHRFAQSGAQEPAASSHEIDDIEIEQIGKTYDALDSNSDGTVTKVELEELMSKLGATLGSNLTSTLDTDGDGNIARDEFINWYKKYMVTDDLTLEERAHSLFQMFDENGSGTITIGEFKQTLDAFNVGFSIDEVGEIVKALDENGDVKIGLEEFVELLEKFHPHSSH